MGAGAGAHPWDGDSPLKIHHSIEFKHQFISGRPPLGEILYPPLIAVLMYQLNVCSLVMPYCLFLIHLIFL